jgi:hypothetical protein
VKLDHLEVRPSTLQTLSKNFGLNVTVNAYDANSTELNNVKYTWSIEPVSMGTINKTSGAYVYFKAGVQPGECVLKVSGEYKSIVKTATVSITVLNISRILDHISISPSEKQTMYIGNSLRFTAKAYDTNGTEIKGFNFNWGLIGSIGTITPNSGTWTVFSATAKGNGTVTVFTTYNGVEKSSEVKIEVIGSSTENPNNVYSVGIITGAITIILVTLFILYFARKKKHKGD